MKKDKKEKQVFIDDGRTIFSMEQLVGSENYNKKEKNAYLTKKECKAVVKAAYATYFPMLLGVLACFSLAILLIYIWLK